MENKQDFERSKKYLRKLEWNSIIYKNVLLVKMVMLEGAGGKWWKSFCSIVAVLK